MCKSTGLLALVCLWLRVFPGVLEGLSPETFSWGCTPPAQSPPPSLLQDIRDAKDSQQQLAPPSDRPYL